MPVGVSGQWNMEWNDATVQTSISMSKMME